MVRAKISTIPRQSPVDLVKDGRDGAGSEALQCESAASSKCFCTDKQTEHRKGLYLQPEKSSMTVSIPLVEGSLRNSPTHEEHAYRSSRPVGLEIPSFRPTSLLANADRLKRVALVRVVNILQRCRVFCLLRCRFRNVEIDTLQRVEVRVALGGHIARSADFSLVQSPLCAR